MTSDNATLMENGYQAYVAGNYMEALQYLSSFIQSESASAKAYDLRGSIYKALHRYEDALCDYNQALTLNPDFKNASRNRGHVYRHLDLYHAAKADFERAQGDTDMDDVVEQFIQIVNQKIQNSA